MRKRLRKKLAKKRKPLRWATGKVSMKILSDSVGDFKELSIWPVNFRIKEG